MIFGGVFHNVWLKYVLILKHSELLHSGRIVEYLKVEYVKPQMIFGGVFHNVWLKYVLILKHSELLHSGP